MSLLGNIVKGKISQPDLMIIYGTDGVGKSTFASQAPETIFLGVEEGTAELVVSRYPKKLVTYQDFLDALKDITDNEHGYKTLAVDSLDWLEPLVWDQVCKDASVTQIEQAYGGYGKGYLAANKIWQDLMTKLTALRQKRKMNIILIAHSQIKVFNDPQTNSAYDRYQLKLNDKAAALWREYVDSVFFASYETYTKEERGKKTKAMGDGSRIMHTERRPAFDAKCRLGLPVTLSLDWNAYVQAKAQGTPEKLETVQADLQQLVSQIDAALRPAVEASIVKAEQNVGRLLVIRNRLRTLLAQ